MRVSQAACVASLTQLPESKPTIGLCIRLVSILHEYSLNASLMTPTDKALELEVTTGIQYWTVFVSITVGRLSAEGKLCWSELDSAGRDLDTILVVAWSILEQLA